VRIVGIDPGLSGAIAMLDTTDNSLSIYAIEVTKATHGRGNQVNTPLLIDNFDMMFGDADHVWIERVQAGPKDGSSAAFKFGYVAGLLRGVVAGHNLPVSFVTPAKWKMSMGVTKDKGTAVARAGELFPNYGHRFVGPRGGLLDGIAEAVLLAYYGAREMKEIS
jgi:hypothetical protein